MRSIVGVCVITVQFVLVYNEAKEGRATEIKNRQIKFVFLILPGKFVDRLFVGH